MLHTIVGGNITLFTKLCENTTEEALDVMVSHGEELEANAVFGIKYDATELMNRILEVLCYGAAIVVSCSK